MDGQNFNNEQNNMYQDNTNQQVVPPVYNNNQSAPQNQSNALAIVSLVMGILSIVLCCCYGIGIIFGIIGLVCAIIAKKKGQSAGMSTAGLICSIIGSVFSVIAIIYFAYCIFLVATDPTYTDLFNSYYYY